MSVLHAGRHSALGISIVGGIVYAGVVLSWMLSQGLYVSGGEVGEVVVGLVYAVGGLVVMAAVPLYLLIRYSAVLPAGTTLWFLGNTVNQHLYGSHLHPLSSYLIVWPLLFAIALGTGILEAVCRVALGRTVGRGGFRQLL